MVMIIVSKQESIHRNNKDNLIHTIAQSRYNSQNKIKDENITRIIQNINNNKKMKIINATSIPNTNKYNVSTIISKGNSNGEVIEKSYVISKESLNKILNLNKEKINQKSQLIKNSNTVNSNTINSNTVNSNTVNTDTTKSNTVNTDTNNANDNSNNNLKNKKYLLKQIRKSAGKSKKSKSIKVKTKTNAKEKVKTKKEETNTKTKLRKEKSNNNKKLKENESNNNKSNNNKKLKENESKSNNKKLSYFVLP
jgi:hypothetical protein